ncbi:MAG TPA: DNA-processing protein DprA [Candidatus Limnocylindrales bacterium]
MNERDAWIVLATTDQVGPETMAALIARYGTARDVLDRGAAGELPALLAGESVEAPGTRLTKPVRDGIAAWRSAGLARLERIAGLGLWAVTALDPDYPAVLREIDPPPPLLLGSGDRSLLNAPRLVALVGTRRPTPAGRWLAAQVAARLVECQAVVVSGLAVGIDGVAHATTLDRGGLTLGVIGGGHEHPGVRAHAPLRRRIVERGGAIVSEYAPQVEPTKGTYPQRNRIIAALAEATIVIEAPARSGARITAGLALSLGRPVFVAPGRVGDWATAGSLALLRDTPARVLAGIDELTEDLGFFEPAPVAATADPAHPAEGELPASGALALLGAAERAVAERLRRAPAGLDVLVNDTGLAPQVVSSAVTLLLMRGWLQPVGPAYVAAGPLLR